MKKTIICGAIIVFVALVFWLNNSTITQSFESIGAVMQHMAGEAVSHAGKHHGIVLDYSEKSISDVETILGALHEKYGPSQTEEQVYGTALAYGAYIGEVIRRGNPGSKWEHDHPVVGENSYPLHWLDGDVFPVAWCYKRIVNGPGDDVRHKYIMSKQSREQK